MQTKVEKITPESLEYAKEIILGGGVVAIPTETVYGLGGNAFDDLAVKKIFEVKGRPADNPLIAHVHPDYDLSSIIDYEPPYAKKLRDAFCPGPLTLVYPSKNKVSPLVSCGLNTLAVRIPSHAGAQALLRSVNIPVVAPSANVSKHVSPTSAKHVFDDFNGKIPLILDGGVSTGGIESTVCDVTGEVPMILRPGLITKEMIEGVCGTCLTCEPTVKKGGQAKSPGMLYKHYSPRCETRLYQDDQVSLAFADYEKESASGKKVVLLCEHDVYTKAVEKGFNAIDLGALDKEMAANLYAALRDAELIAELLIAIEPKEKSGVMVGVLNRLIKACKSQDIAH